MRCWLYTAYSWSTVLPQREFVGTLTDAKKAARAYARAHLKRHAKRPRAIALLDLSAGVKLVEPIDNGPRLFVAVPERGYLLR